ncbi:MAG: hypothetical protein ABIE94_04150 [archaeon]
MIYCIVKESEPLKAELFPSCTDRPASMLTALVLSAYEQSRTIVVGQAIPEDGELSEREARRFLRYRDDRGLPRKLLEKILRFPDQRVVLGVDADEIRGVKTELHVCKYPDGTYYMTTERDVAHLTELLEMTKERLETS